MGNPHPPAPSHTKRSYLPKPTRFDQRFTDSSLHAQPFAQTLDTHSHTHTHVRRVLGVSALVRFIVFARRRHPGAETGSPKTPPALLK